MVCGRAESGADTKPLTRPGQAEPLPRRRLVFVVIGLSLLAFAVDQTAVAMALTTLGRDLGVGIAWAAWVITTYALGQILVLPLASRLCDRFGARRVVLASVAVFSLMSLFSGLAPGIWQLLVCRLVQGMACGALLPSGNAIVAYVFGRDRDRAVAMFTNVFPIGAVIGPLLGGFYLAFGSWRLVFLCNAPIGLLLLAACAVMIPNLPRRASSGTDPVGILLLMVSLLAGMTAATQLGSLESGRLAVIVLTVGVMVAIGCGMQFLRHLRSHPHPVVNPRLLTGGGLGAMNFTNFVIGSSSLGFSTLVPVYAQLRYAITPLAAGTLLTVRALCIVITSAGAVGFLRRLGYKPILLAGMSTTVLGLVLTVAPAEGIPPAAWLTGAAAVMGVGMGLSAPASSNGCMHLVPDEVPAVAGLRLLFRQVGAIVAISLVTAVTATAPRPGLAMAVGFGVLAVVMLGSILVASRLPHHRGRW